MVDHVVSVGVDAVTLISLVIKVRKAEVAFGANMVVLVMDISVSAFDGIVVRKFVSALLEMVDLVLLIFVDTAGLVASSTVEYVPVVIVFDESDSDLDGIVILEVLDVLDTD